MSAWSGQLRVDIQLISWNAFYCSQLRRLTGGNQLTVFLTYLLTFFLTFLMKFFLTSLSDISSDILSLISFDMLSDISSDILSDISKTKHSIHNFTQKSFHKLYIYLKPRSKSNIHNNFVFVKWQFYSCIRLHRTAPPRSNWVPRCHASEYTAATTSHGVCKPWSQMHVTVPLAPLRCNWPCSAQHWFATHILQPPKRTPKFERLEHAAICNSPPLIRHIAQGSLHNLWHNKYTIAKMRSVRRLHANVDALSTNPRSATHAQLLWQTDWPSQWRSSQDVPPPAPPWLPNRTHLLAYKKLSQQYLLQCATSNNTTLALLHFL